MALSFRFKDGVASNSNSFDSGLASKKCKENAGLNVFVTPKRVNNGREPLTAYNSGHSVRTTVGEVPRTPMKSVPSNLIKSTSSRLSPCTPMRVRTLGSDNDRCVLFYL